MQVKLVVLVLVGFTEDFHEDFQIKLVYEFINRLSFHSYKPLIWWRPLIYPFYLFDSNNSILIWFGTILKCQWAQSQIWFLNIQITSKPHSTKAIIPWLFNSKRSFLFWNLAFVDFISFLAPTGAREVLLVQSYQNLSSF